MESIQRLLEEALRLQMKHSELEEIRDIQEQEQSALEQFGRVSDLTDDRIDQDFVRICTKAIEDGLPEDVNLQNSRQEITQFLKSTSPLSHNTLHGNFTPTPFKKKNNY